MSGSPQHNPISPPTPAPSPQPELHSLLPSLAANANASASASANANASSTSSASNHSRLGPSPLSNSTTFNANHSSESLDLISQLLSSLPLGQSQEKDLAILLALLGRVYPNLQSNKLKSSFLNSLVSLCTLSDLTQLSSLINPRLKLDFFTSLPIEVSLLCLSFIDDPKTLARAMQVSTRWKSLVEDEGTWKGMCEKHRFEMQEEDGEEQEEDEEQEQDEEDQEDPNQQMEFQLGSQSNHPFGGVVQENQIFSSIPSTSTSSTSTSINTSTPIPNPVPSTFTPLSTSTSSSAGPSTNSNKINTDTILMKGSSNGTQLSSLSRQSQEVLLRSLQERFQSNGLDPGLEEISREFNAFHQRLDTTESHAFVADEKTTTVELILREVCQEMFGGLAVDGVGAQDAFGKNSQAGHDGYAKATSGAGDGDGDGDTEMMDLDSDSSSRSKNKNSKDSISRIQSLGKGRPSISPLPLNFKRNQSLASDFNFKEASASNSKSRNASSSTSRRTFSYRTHFKLAYLTESNWLRGGRLLTQHTSSDNGAVVTSLAMDSEWIVVGMANSKIHVFDAKTGLFVRTLQGHESGVWCLCLVSKTNEATERIRGKEKESSFSKDERTKINLNSAASLKSQGLRSNNQPLMHLDDSNGNGNGIQNDLKLIHHDKRRNATSFSIDGNSRGGRNGEDNRVVQRSPNLEHPVPTYAVNSNGSRLARDLVSKVDGKERPESHGKSETGMEDSDPTLIAKGKAKEQTIDLDREEDEKTEIHPTLYWFFKSKNSLAQKETSANLSFNKIRQSSLGLSSSSSSSSSPSPLSNPSGIKEDKMVEKVRERGIELANAEAEAGEIRDSILRNGGRIPEKYRSLSERRDGNQGQDDDDDEDGDHDKDGEETKKKRNAKGKGKGKAKEKGNDGWNSAAPTSSTSALSSRPNQPTSFSNFGPFNAGIEGEMGIGGEPHLVGEDEMNMDQDEETTTTTTHDESDLNGETNQDQADEEEEEEVDHEEEEEEEEEEEWLQRPYSPSDYERAFGEAYDEDGNESSMFHDGVSRKESDVEMSSQDDDQSQRHDQNQTRDRQDKKNDAKRKFSASQFDSNSVPKSKPKTKTKFNSAFNSTSTATSGSNFNPNNQRSNRDRDNSHVLTGSSKGFGNRHALVVSGACDRTVRVWDLRTGTCKHVLKGHTSTVRCLKVLDGRPLAISGSRDSTLRVWDLRRGCLVHLLSGHQNSVRCIEVHGTRVVSGSYDCTARIWNVLNGKCLNILRGHFHQIYAVAFDGNIVATGSLDSTVRVYDAEDGKCRAVLQGHTSLVGQLQLTNSILITGGSDGRVIIFCLKTFQCLHRLCAHDNSVTCLQFDDKFIVTGGNDGKVKLWNFKTGAFIREICEPSEQVWKVSYRDDKCVVLCKRQGKTSMDVITFRPPAEE